MITKPPSIVLLAALLAACSSTPPDSPTAATDPQTVEPSPSTETATDPQRIVVLGGAVAEVVCALDACDRLVGRDITAMYPPAIQELPSIGYFRRVPAEGVLALKPDLVLASSHAGPPEALTQIKAAGVEVVVVPDVATVESVTAKILAIGSALGRSADAERLAASSEDAIAAARQRVPEGEGPTALFLYARGRKAVHVGGSGSAGAAMLELAGARPAMPDLEGTQPLTAEAVLQADPEVLLVPTKGLESLGGVDSLVGMPGLGATRAGQSRRIIAVEDLLLLGFGPRTGEALTQVIDGLYGTP